MKKNINNKRISNDFYKFRLTILVAMVIMGSMILILRLAYLQFSQYKRFATLSLKNQMSIIPIAPPRGVILDRNGVVIADSLPVYVLEITPDLVKNIPDTLQRLKILLTSISDEDIENFYRSKRQNHVYDAIPLKLKLTQEEVAIFASNQYQFPGVHIKAQLMRHYPFGEVAAHLLGYVGRINVQELKQVDSTNYRATAFIGKSGIEKYYEPLLHGQVGYQQVETDVSGRTVRVISKQNPIAGAKIYLTIDMSLQQAAFRALDNKRGAVVLMNVRHGEILAMASTPSFDPNLFVNGISTNAYKQLSMAHDRPLFNRAVRGLYPPASTIKPFMAITGLDKGVVSINTKIYDPGWYKLPGVSHQYRDWKHTGHGSINIQRAITVSCDTYFYQLGNKLGITAMEDMLVQFGFGQLTHVDLYEEASGIMPSPHWKRQRHGLPWYPGDTVITSIGQGFMLASPLQLANAVASLSQHGRRFRPHLLLSSRTENGEIKKYNALEEYPVQLKDNEYWNIVIEAMRAVITNNEGTGYRFGRNATFTVAAKTGTAQVFGLSQKEKNPYHDVPEELRDHSVFIAFAPVEKPEVAIAVIVENDVLAAHVARLVMEDYFKKRVSS